MSCSYCHSSLELKLPGVHITAESRCSFHEWRKGSITRKQVTGTWEVHLCETRLSLGGRGGVDLGPGAKGLAGRLSLGRVAGDRGVHGTPPMGVNMDA